MSGIELMAWIGAWFLFCVIVNHVIDSATTLYCDNDAPNRTTMTLFWHVAIAAVIVRAVDNLFQPNRRSKK